MSCCPGLDQPWYIEYIWVIPPLLTLIMLIYYRDILEFMALALIVTIAEAAESLRGK